MPTYEYRCPNGHEFDLFQSMSDEPSAECPDCGETSQRLLSGGAGFIFKGEGFYITDYRSDEYKKAASSEKESATASDKASDTSDSPSSEKASSTSDTSAKESSTSDTSAKESSSSSGSAKSGSSDD